jgi:hypothetical protein
MMKIKGGERKKEERGKIGLFISNKTICNLNVS